MATTQPLPPVLSTVAAPPTEPVYHPKGDSFRQDPELMEDLLLGVLLLVVLAALALVVWRANREIQGLAKIVSVPAQRSDADP